MPLPNLDEVTRNGLNELNVNEVSSEVSYAYNHELLWYGVDAVAHVHLMKMARDISEGKLSLDEFIDKYNLDCIGSPSYGFFVPLDKIESDGIFVPQQTYLQNLKKTCFFDQDYINRVLLDSWVEKEYANKLIGRKWQLSDLENPALIEQGVKFGRDMWRTCVEGFHQLKNGDPGSNDPAQPKKVTDLCKKLIDYYSTLIFEPAH
ncbi:hypothetical protein ISS05_04150 [Candidatus Woesearchaeota archaeon]|nr:hypothetical protein [Candidatus Woesearchaeota archaeon]